MVWVKHRRDSDTVTVTTVGGTGRECGLEDALLTSSSFPTPSDRSRRSGDLAALYGDYDLLLDKHLTRTDLVQDGSPHPRPRRTRDHGWRH